MSCKQSGAPVPASHSGESGVGGPPWTSGGCPPAVGDDGVGSPPWASGECPPGFCGHNLGGLPQIPLAYSDFKIFSIFPGGMASHSGESGVGSPPWASGGCPPGFCGNDLGGLPQTPLANSDFSSLFNFPEVYASHSGEPGVGGSPGPPGGCPPGLGAAPGGLAPSSYLVLSSQAYIYIYVYISPNMFSPHPFKYSSIIFCII